MLKSKRQRLEEAEDEESDYERRSENEKRGNSKLFDLLEGTHLVVRDEKGILNISPVLAELVRKMSEMKNDYEGNDWLPEIDIPFNEITVEDDLLPEYSFWRITLNAPPEDTKDVRSSVGILGKFKTKIINKLPALGIDHDMPGDEMAKYFGLKGSPSQCLPSQLCSGRTGLPFVSPLINQLKLSYIDGGASYHDKEFGGNPLYECSKEFYSRIWCDETLLDAEKLIRDQTKSLRKIGVPILRDFESGEVGELAYVDWQFQMNSHLSEMTMFYSEMITLPLPFAKNESGVSLECLFPKYPAIIMMDNALINFYQEAIAKNTVIQAQLPNRLSIKSVNELVQAIEGIFLPQSPDAIAHRQSLFHKLVQNENEETPALMNRIMLYLRMFEYTLRPKDLVDLIGCMYLTFKNRSLYVQARDKFLSGAQNKTLDFGQLLRNISETEKAMREINGSASESFQEEQLFYMRHDRCSICKRLGHDAAHCNTRSSSQPSTNQRGRYNSEPSQRANVTLQQYTHSDRGNMGGSNQSNSRGTMSSVSGRNSASRGMRPRRSKFNWKNQNTRYSGILARGGHTQSRSGQLPSAGGRSVTRGGRGGSWNSSQYGGSHPTQGGRNYYGNRGRSITPFNPVNQQANVTCLNNESEIFHDDSSMHEHAAVLLFTDPPENGVTDCTVDVDDDDLSDISDDPSESGLMSVSMSVSDPTSFEVSTSIGDHLNLTTVVECVNPPTCMTPTILNSSCSYFMYRVENSTSLENETMSFMCSKYPHLREQIQSLHSSGMKWDDMINEIFNNRERATTVAERLTDGRHPISDVYAGPTVGDNQTSRMSKRQREGDEDEGPVSDAEFREDLFLHQELLHDRHPFWGSFSIIFKILMPQNRELSVTLKYTNTVADMKHAICTATGVPITDFYLMNGVRVLLDDDTLLKSRLSARVGIYLRFRLRGG